jgi:hypothetical protein
MPTLERANKQPRSKLRGIERQEPKAYAASGGEYDPKRLKSPPKPTLAKLTKVGSPTSFILSG